MTTKRADGAKSRALKGWLVADPAKATEHVLAAVIKGKGHLPSIAIELEVSERTLDRILKAKPEISAAAASMRDATKTIAKAMEVKEPES
jgi:hypothetical protein